MKYVGAHMSIAKGFHDAVFKSIKMKANAMAFFVQSPRSWNSKPLNESLIIQFKKACQENNINPKKQILVHGSYMTNLSNPEKEKRAMSSSLILEEMKKCELLGIGLFNVHPGSTLGKISKKKAITFLAEEINKLIKKTNSIVFVIETMAGQGNTLGESFQELKNIIDLIEDKTRIGVCIDTCHIYSAGYNIKTKEAFDKVFSSFDKIIGFEYLRGMHLNDSKTPFNSKKDRHEHLGKGSIGLDVFKFIMEDPRFDNIPLIIETPDPNNYPNEIEKLLSFSEK